jgi:hypothetical protein
MALFVQGHADGNSGTETFTSATTAGNTVIVIIGDYDTPTTVVSALKLGGAAVPYTQVLAFPQTTGAGSPQGCCIAMMPNVPGGQTVVTYSYSGTSVIATAIMEVSGLGPCPYLDQLATAAGATNSIASGLTPETTALNEFIVAGAATYNGSTSPPSEGYWNTDIGINNHLSTGYYEPTGLSTYSWTQSTGGNIGWAAVVAAIAPTPGWTQQPHVYPSQAALQAAAWLGES